MVQPFGSIEEERAARFKSLERDGADAQDDLHAALATLDEAVAVRVRAAYEFAESLEYEHPGMTARSYLAHPVRVACMALKAGARDADTLTLALLHNVFEHTKLSHAEIAHRFGASIADGIRILTVDRTQGSAEYKASYYGGLARAPAWVRAVKVLDKLDNMFVLCTNSSAGVRNDYLNEIETYVLSMAREALPHLHGYMVNLASDCRTTGHIPRPKAEEH